MTQTESFVLSKAQLDRLGERLRLGTHTEEDLRALDGFRKSFRSSYEVAARAIREQLRMEASDRPAKTVGAISAKLRRQRIRLTQIQDIAGLRIVVTDLDEQDSIVGRLVTLFPAAHVDDRRSRPSNGYRAVHVVLEIEGKSVEIQVRTQEQHLWAELSERIADVVDPNVKYGGGPTEIRGFLDRLSQKLSQEEVLEREAQALQDEVADFRRQVELLGQTAEQAGLSLQAVQESERRILALKVVANTQKRQLGELLKNLIAAVRMNEQERK